MQNNILYFVYRGFPTGLLTILKGKLLLKIYDKFKVIKIKDILKKTVTKWKNNTIFLDKIKNKVNEENINKFKR